MRCESVRDSIGHTPLVRLNLGADDVAVYAKLELHNPFAMKDRAARNLVLEARRVGALADGAPIVESSSGTMALGLALVGRSLGHDVHIVTDPRIDRITLAKLRALGCEVHMVHGMTGHGWQSARLELLAHLLDDLPGAFWPQQYSNPDNPAGYRELAEELVSDLGSITTLVGPVGSGGSLCGTSRALRLSIPDLRVVAVDCVGSVLFDQPDVPQRLQSGLGNSLRPRNLDRRLIDEIHWLNDHEAFAAARDLAREQQIFAGNTSGSVYRVLTDVAARARPGDRIVGILPDRGDRYGDTVYSDEHWAEKGLPSLPVADTPEQVPYGSVVRCWSRASLRDVPAPQALLLFVESNTTGSGMAALRTTLDMGLRPVLVTGDPERYPGLAEQSCVVLRCDTNSLVALRNLVLDSFSREQLAGVTTTSEFYVPAAAELTRWLGLRGDSPEAVNTCRNKATQRVALAAAGIRQPRFAAVRSVTDIATAVAEVGLPCVVKPVAESGSRDVVLCDSVREASAHARRILETEFNVRGQPMVGTVLVEEYLDAPEFSVELFGWAGTTECVGITAKSVTTSPGFVEYRHVFPARLPSDVAAGLVAVARRAVEAVGLCCGPTHTELRLTADGPAVIEINPRLAGGMIPEIVRLATGVDLLAQQLRAAVDLPPRLRPTVARHAGIQFLLSGQTGTLREVRGTAAAGRIEGVERVTVTMPAGAAVRPARDAYDRLGHVIAGHGDPDEVGRILDRALGQVEVVVEAADVETGSATAAPRVVPTIGGHVA